MKSQTQELLALPEINHSGVRGSIVFAALPASTQAEIRRAPDEAARVAIACRDGDGCPAIKEIYQALIAEPARKRAAGVPWAEIADPEGFFLFRCLTPEQQDRVRAEPDEDAKHFLFDRYLAENGYLDYEPPSREAREYLAAGDIGEVVKVKTIEDVK